MTQLGRRASGGQVSSYHEMKAQKVGNRKNGKLCINR